MIPYCGECPFFKYECTDGWGWCDIKDKKAYCETKCNLVYETLKPYQAVKILHYAQKWRRGAKMGQIQPYLLGIGIDRAINELRKIK